MKQKRMFRHRTPWLIIRQREGILIDNFRCSSTREEDKRVRILRRILNQNKFTAKSQTDVTLINIHHRQHIYKSYKITRKPRVGSLREYDYFDGQRESAYRKIQCKSETSMLLFESTGMLPRFVTKNLLTLMLFQPCRFSDATFWIYSKRTFEILKKYTVCRMVFFCARHVWGRYHIVKEMIRLNLAANCGIGNAGERG